MYQFASWSEIQIPVVLFTFDIIEMTTVAFDITVGQKAVHCNPPRDKSELLSTAEANKVSRLFVKL